MCGITGFWQTSRSGQNWPPTVAIERMNERLYHRGPDDGGTWVDEEQGVALANRRLAIIDLSPEGHQPMVSASGRFVVVFNGEIYNYQTLRSRLEAAHGYRWRGHSDTEVLAEAIECWGIEDSLRHLVGMFAFACWDRREQRLTLARDRAGEKPLYWGTFRDTLLFGSEIKALAEHPAWQSQIDRQALTLFLRYNYVPAPYTIFSGIYKLPPGTYLSFSAESIRQHQIEQPVAYWSMQMVAESARNEPFEGNEHDALQELETLLRASVSGQMLADVPLGAFLSGGIDSSTIVALMQALSTQPIKTFSIGFLEEGYNEAAYAKAVAAHLGTDHTELYVTASEAQAVIPEMSLIYDEPFADSSQIPTYLVARLARRAVTVSLSGDGGDELFGGYNRYFWGTQIVSQIGILPAGLRKVAAHGLLQISPDRWSAMANWLPSFIPGAREPLFGHKIHKLAHTISFADGADAYRRYVSSWLTPEELVLGAKEPATLPTSPQDWPQWLSLAQQMMYVDTVTYLPDDILAKVDRAAMAVSLETRVPFLDHRVIEFAWRLPLELKLRNGQGKWLLRQLLYTYVPPELIDRPKSGFGLPIAEWLRGPLRPWVEAMLSENRLSRESLLAPAPIRRRWQEHLSGERNWFYQLWGVLMFQAWMERQSQTTSPVTS